MVRKFQPLVLCCEVSIATITERRSLWRGGEGVCGGGGGEGVCGGGGGEGVCGGGWRGSTVGQLLIVIKSI